MFICNSVCLFCRFFPESCTFYAIVQYCCYILLNQPQKIQFAVRHVPIMWIIFDLLMFYCYQSLCYTIMYTFHTSVFYFQDFVLLMLMPVVYTELLCRLFGVDLRHVFVIFIISQMVQSMIFVCLIVLTSTTDSSVRFILTSFVPYNVGKKFIHNWWIWWA